jgi:uncharacterized protein YkwD
VATSQTRGALKRPTARAVAVVVGVTLVVGVFVGVVAQRHVAVNSPSLGSEARPHEATGSLIVPGLPADTPRGEGLYRANDPWKAYLAGEQACPGGERLGLALARQADTMICLVNFARRKRGLQPVTSVVLLNRTSLLKANKIQRCDDFSHDACGEGAVDDTRAAGYRGPWGENLFIATGAWGAPRPALDGWLNSAEHRENLFWPAWRTAGIAVMKMAKFGDDDNVTLWVNEFGTS